MMHHKFQLHSKLNIRDPVRELTNDIIGRVKDEFDHLEGYPPNRHLEILHLVHPVFILLEIMILLHCSRLEGWNDQSLTSFTRY